MLVNRCGNGVPCSEGEHQANRRTEFKILSVGTEKEQSGTFDPAMFIEGDLIPVQLLEAGFFKGCLQSGEKPIPEKATPPVSVKADQTRVEPAVKKETAKEPSGISLAPDAVQAGNKQSWFAVQIYAITSLSQARKLDFKGETVYSKPVDKYTKYYVGRYTDWKTANKERLRLNHLFPGCFLVAFKEGEIVPVNELRKMLEK